MKLRLFPFSMQILLSVMILYFLGCTQDEIPNYNYFKINDKVYEIKYCVISKHFEDDTSGVFDIGFYLDLKYIDIDSTDNVINVPFYENGVFFGDCMFSGSLDQGLYHVIDPTCGWGYCVIKKNYFYNGKIQLNIEEPETRIFDFLTGGELLLKIEGENYIIEFNCTYKEYENKKIVGHFSGIPIECN